MQKSRKGEIMKKNNKSNSSGAILFIIGIIVVGIVFFLMNIYYDQTSIVRTYNTCHAQLFGYNIGLYAQSFSNTFLHECKMAEILIIFVNFEYLFYLLGAFLAIMGIIITRRN